MCAKVAVGGTLAIVIGLVERGSGDPEWIGGRQRYIEGAAVEEGMFDGVARDGAAPVLEVPRIHQAVEEVGVGGDPVQRHFTAFVEGANGQESRSIRGVIETGDAGSSGAIFVA